MTGETGMALAVADDLCVQSNIKDLNFVIAFSLCFNADAIELFFAFLNKSYKFYRATLYAARTMLLAMSVRLSVCLASVSSKRK